MWLQCALSQAALQGLVSVMFALQKDVGSVVKELILKSSASEKVYSTKTEQLVIAFKALAL